MPRDYTQQPRTHIRRKDRAVAEDAWIKKFLNRVPTGVLAVSLDGQPFANSNLFVYDEEQHAVILHTAREGRLRAVTERNPRACFSVHEMGRLLPADEALEFSVEYGGVSIFGHLSIVEEEGAASLALQLLLDRYFPHLTPGEDYRPVIPAELKRTSVFKLSIEEWVGKEKNVEEDFPGAFVYPVNGNS